MGFAEMTIWQKVMMCCPAFPKCCFGLALMKSQSN